MRIWGAHALPLELYLSTITSKIVVYSSAERADTIPQILLYSYMYSMGSDSLAKVAVCYSLGLYLRVLVTEPTTHCKSALTWT